MSTNSDRYLMGNMGCLGCGLNILIRHLVAEIEKPIVFTVGACCFSVVQSGGHFKTSINTPCINTPFAAPDSVASGITISLNRKKIDSCVIAFGGDGGADIGFSALSGAAARNDNILRIVYSNQVYSNTGGQKSESSYRSQITTTTSSGKKTNIRDLVKILWGHNLPYMATASIGDLKDLKYKIKKASTIVGYKFLLIDTPCPTSWSFDPKYTLKVGELALKTGLFPLIEISENGKLAFNGITKKIVNGNTKRLPINKYIDEFPKRFNTANRNIELLENDIDLNLKKLYLLSK